MSTNLTLTYLIIPKLSLSPLNYARVCSPYKVENAAYQLIVYNLVPTQRAVESHISTVSLSN